MNKSLSSKSSSLKHHCDLSETIHNLKSKKQKRGENQIEISYRHQAMTSSRSEFFSDKNNNIFPSIQKLGRSFYTQPCLLLAKKLLGKILSRRLSNGDILRGRIVETESYLGAEDKSSHSYQGKRTERNEAMFLSPGTAYVYSIYGMYYCFNISSFEEGSAVLIRAIQPLEGSTTMKVFRSNKRKSSKLLKEKDICNGPSKLCEAFKIDKNMFNKIDLCLSNELWLENEEDIMSNLVVACKRIGIESAGEEWANKPFRFYIRDCPFVSVRDELAENTLM